MSSPGRLQYRRSQSGRAAVDWEAYEETLARVDPRFADPRFDSLKHVLTVLSSPSAEQELAEVGAAEDRAPAAAPRLLRTSAPPLRRM